MEKPLVLAKPELNVSVSLSQNPIPIMGGVVSVDVLLEINPVIPTADSIPLDVCVVVDCSGSMNSSASHKTRLSKIDAVRNGLLKIVNKMAPTDRIRVIGFSDNAFEILPWTEIRTADMNSVVHTLETELHARSSTYFKNALEMSLENGLGAHGLPLIVLLTDGQSSNSHVDHPYMVKFVDHLREKKIPIIIYGTGADYNLNLLSQLAIRAGNGSLLYHVLSVEDLESHLTGELAFRHGLCLENVHISVFHSFGAFTGVYRFIPQERELVKRDPSKKDHDDAGCYVEANGRGFENACGSIDHLRGQKFLFHMEVPIMVFRDDCLFNLVIKGNKPGEIPFVHTLRIPAKTTMHPLQCTENPEVQKYKLMVEATKAVKERDYARGAQIYTRMGRADLAQTLVQLSEAGEDEEATSRGTTSFACSTASVVLSAEDIEQFRKSVTGGSK